MKTIKQATILLVDDDPMVLDSAARLLSEAGLSVTGCGDGHTALNRLREDSFDAVLSDIKMPGMTGLELLEKIHVVDPEIPVLLMTGYAELEMAVAAIQGGVFDFILKPFTPAQLYHAVEKALSFKHLKQFEKNFPTLLAQRLEETKRELQATFAQRLQGEKPTAAGQLTSAVVEEIKQPLDTIITNLRTLHGHVAQWQVAIALADQAIRPPTPRSPMEQHRNPALAELRENILPALTRSLEEAERIQKTLQNLTPISAPGNTSFTLD